MMTNIFKRMLGVSLVCGTAFALISCEHKPLYPKDNLFPRKINVNIDWSALESGDSTPASIDMYFYNELLEDYELINIPNNGQPHTDSVTCGIVDVLFYSHGVQGIRTIDPEVIEKHTLLNEFPETNVNPIYGGTCIIDLMNGDPDQATDITIRPVCLNQHMNVIITNASKLAANKDLNIVSFKGFSDRYAMSGKPSAEDNTVIVSDFLTKTGNDTFTSAFRFMQMHQSTGFKYPVYVFTVNSKAEIECYYADVTESVRKQINSHGITIEVDFESMIRVYPGDENYIDPPFTIQGGFNVDIDPYGDKGITIIL